jgi:SAM-dependent methyltransferase
MERDRPSLVFDRVAHEYDDTRGGVPRGRHYARSIEPHLTPGCRVVELGVGTGAIALPLTELGHHVVGFDLSPAMLARAHERIGNRVALADVHRLPVASASTPAVLTVWVLHVVADPAAVVHEIARILEPGGRWCAIASDARSGTSDLDLALQDLNRAVGRFRDAPDRVRAWAAGAGLRLVHEGHTVPFEFEEAPNAAADHIETRTMSSLWDLDDAQWAELVQPHVDRLRALPDPDRPRPRSLGHPVTVFER